MNNNTTNRKVVIIGAGHVGSHAGYALVSQNLVEEIVYIDVDEKKALAQALDLYDSTFTRVPELRLEIIQILKMQAL